MALQDDKFKLFEGIAKSQGFSAEEIEPFREFAKIKMMEMEQAPGLGTDLPYLRQIAGEEREAVKAKAKEKKEKEEEFLETYQQVENYRAGITPIEELSTKAKSLLRGQREAGGLPKILSTEDQEQFDTANSTVQNAKNILDVLDKIDSGQVSGEQARVALNFVAGQYAQSTFDTGGKTLTENEQALLQGTRPTLEITKANIIERAFGKVPKQTGNVLDTNAELRQKMEMAVKLSLKDQATLQGQPTEPITEGLTPIPQKESMIKKLGVGALNLIVNPAVRAVKNYAQLLGTAAGVAALPTISKISPEAGANLADILEPVVKNKYATPTQALVTGGLETLSAAGTAFDVATLGQGSLIKQTAKLGARNLLINSPIFGLGEGLKASREGGDINEAVWSGMTGQSFTGPFVGMFGENSVTESADVATAIFVPIIGGKMIEKFYTGRAIEKPYQKKLNSNIEDSFLNRLGRDVKGKTATGLVKLKASDKESVVRAEKLVQDTINITKKNSIRGIAKELPQVQKSARNYVIGRASELDDTLGGVDKLKISNTIKNELAKSAVAQADPKLFQKHLETVDNLLGEGQIPYSKLDQTRINMNKGIAKNWFNNGTPIRSNPEKLSYLKWITSQIIKDIFADTKGAEDVGKAIAIQHTAIAGEPIFSRTALGARKLTGSGATKAIVNLFANMFDAIATPIKIKTLRQPQNLPEIPQSQGLPEVPQALPGGGGGLPPIQQNLKYQKAPYLYK